MEKKNNFLRVGSLSVLWGVLAILFCATPSLHADETVPAGETWDINYAVTGNLLIDGTANLLAGAAVTESIYVQDGGTLNMHSGSVGAGWWISVSLNAAGVTVFGTDFKVDGVPYETPASVIILYGTLTGKYEDGSDINLVFMSDIPIHLAAPVGGGPTPIYIDIKPGSYPNSINLGSHGVIPVAILSTADFDATTLNAENIFLAGSGVRIRGKGNKYLASEEDVNGDGLIDLVVKVETENLDPGEFADGGAFLRVRETSDPISPVLYEGWDEIRIVPPE